MDSGSILSNILNSPVLFLFMGMMAVVLKSGLEIAITLLVAIIAVAIAPIDSFLAQ